jgi:multidrug resistance efflux pump
MKYSVQRSPRLRQPSRAEADIPQINEPAGPTFNANMQLSYLESVVKEWKTQRTADKGQDERTTPNAPENNIASKPSWMAPVANLRLSTIVKSALAIAVALLLGWTPALRLLATTSAEAVVNARVITLRAPIEGDVTMAAAATDIGSTFRSNEEILTIRNPRADYSHLDSLRRERDQLGTAIAALDAKSQLLTANLTELTDQQENFRIGRIAQLEQRVREIDADIAANEAQHDMAVVALTRANALKKTDAVSQAFLDKALQDERVSKNTIQSLVERRKGTMVELDAAKKGIFVGDSYNDTPQSAQRKMEVALELADVRARLQGSKAELAVLLARIDAETRRNEELSSAVIRSTVNGRVWEILTAPGEHVNAGQDLMRLLDCGSAMVTASVSETAYQKLRIGQSATFRPRGGGKELHGRIVGLNGLAAVSSNSAIQQSMLAREPYHVTLDFPGLAKGADCQIGRSGLVQFDTSPLAASALAD